MTVSSLRERIAERLAAASVETSVSVLAGLERYLELLARWNARINLTALPVQPPTDAALDKLLVEPLVAAPLFRRTPALGLTSGPEVVLRRFRSGWRAVREI